MSVLYKLDARTKLIFVFLFSLLVFLINRLPVAICLLLFFIVIRFLAGVPFRRVKFLMNFTLLAVFVILMQAVFGPGQTYILKPFKWDGLFFGLLIVCRLSAIMLLLPIFTETTPPNLISAGLCALGFNYRTAFIITTAFNLIPFFREEGLAIMDAQKLRGSSSGIKAYSSIAVPLMLGAMRKAQNSSVSMDSRAFGVSKTRTWIDKPKMQTRDFLFITACVVFFPVFLFFNYT